MRVEQKLIYLLQRQKLLLFAGEISHLFVELEDPSPDVLVVLMRLMLYGENRPVF